MSWQALNWASSQQCRTSAEKFVLIMLANHADEQLTCYPRVEVLAEETQLGESTVRRCIANLVKDKRIRVLQRWGQRGSRRSNRYQLLVAGADMALPDSGDWHHEYQPTKKPRAKDSKPPTGSGMEPQVSDTAHSERYDHTAHSERYEPLDPRGMNLSIREVSIEEESPVLEPSLGTPPPVRTDVATNAERQTKEGGDPQKSQPDLEASVAWFASHRPDWRATVIREVLVAGADLAAGDLALACRALRELADKTAVYGKTTSPRRLTSNPEGPWWTAARKATPRAQQPQGRPKPPYCGRCVEATRMLPHEPGERAQKCQSCHPDLVAAAVERQVA